MEKVNAILFDIRSIQKYIFSGNKLRTNIGASHITCNLFQSLLVDEILTEMDKKGLLGSFDKESWKELKTLTELPTDCFVAQVGGGKALILFKPTDDAKSDEENMKNVVRAFNLAVLTRYPGLHTGAAIGVIDLHNFMNSEDKLFEKLKENQNTIYPVVNVPYTGLTLFCDVNGEAATFYDAGHRVATDKRTPPRWYSHEVFAKASKADEANKAMEKEFADVLDGKKFPLEFEDLGQREGENYIAVVHIDGNKMGVKFRKCKEKEPKEQFYEYNKLAKTVQKNTKNAFRAVISHIIKNYERYTRGKDRLDLKEDYLPIRPLIFGGDDVAFVCAAKIALEITTLYMRELITPDVDDSLYTCAGIAILPTSYPFFRGYQLSEQLCSVAKKNSRNVKYGENSCWLDFAILHGEQAPTLEQIRREEYSDASGNNMHFGPYRTDADGNHESISKLFEGAEKFSALPKNKLKEMRGVIARNPHEISEFIEQLKHDGKQVPQIRGWQEYEEKLWNKQGEKMRTPYVDVIEAMDFIIPQD